MQSQENNQAEMSEPDRVRQRKHHVITKLNDKFSDDLWRDRLLKICGDDPSKIVKALNSFLTYIANDEGGREGKKKYIADCSLSSITTAFLEAFQMGIEVGGGRDHSYLVNYDNQCELEISYKGFVYALQKHFDNAFVEAGCVFGDDIFTCEISDTTATYKHIPKSPFEQSWATLKGAYCFFSYTQRENGEKVSRLVRIPKGPGPDSLEMIRSKSRGSKAWIDFPFEQCKKTCIRRASKIPFASIEFGDEDVNPETVDNKHYQLEGDSSDRLKLLMGKQKEIHNEEQKTEPKKAIGVETGSSAPQGKGAPVGDTSPGPAPAFHEAAVPPHPLDVVVPPDGGGGHPEDTGEGYEELSDADFGDPEPVTPAPSPDPVAGEVLPPAPADGWDGQTIMISGKAQKNDFPSAVAAAVYMKKVMSQRKHKASRQGIMAENKLLIAELERQGKVDTLLELRKVSEQGE